MAGRNVSRILLEALRFNGLKEELRDGRHAPSLISSFLLNQFPKCTGTNENVKTIYTASGNLFGYAYVNCEQKENGCVTFVCYKSTPEDNSRTIFTLNCIANNIGSDETANVAIRLIFLDGSFFFSQKEPNKELEERYKGFICDYAFYSKIDASRYQGVVAGKLISCSSKLEINKMLIRSRIKDRPELHDIIFSLVNWKNVALKDPNKIYKAIEDVINVTSLDSFKNDKNLKGRYASDFMIESVFGFNRIGFFIPFTEVELKDDEEIKAGAERFVKGLIKLLSNRVNKKELIERFVFYVPTHVFGENELELDTYFDQFTYRNEYILKDFTKEIISQYFEHPNRIPNA